MVLEKVPFRSYDLSEKADPLDKGKIISVRLNADEYKQLMIIAKSWRISRAGTVLKKLAFVGQNVVLSIFGIDFVKFLLDDKRIIDEDKLDRFVVEKK